MAFSKAYSYGKKTKVKPVTHTNVQDDVDKIRASMRKNPSAVPVNPATGQRYTPEQIAENGRRHNAAARAGTLRPKWSAPKVNNVAGNARQGSTYRVGYADNGTILHLYGAEAGGIPKQVIAVPGKVNVNNYTDQSNKPIATAARKRRRKTSDSWIG